ncbi:19840_t:CDS:2, partial [Gigaspora rosea]
APKCGNGRATMYPANGPAIGHCQQLYLDIPAIVSICAATISEPST